VRCTAVLAARADGQQFHIRHVEFRQLVVAVQGGQPPSVDKALISHYAQNPPAGALMFREDGQKIVTMDGGLCITDNDGTLMLNLTNAWPDSTLFNCIH